jgi:DNA-binding NtrC family response regulator
MATILLVDDDPFQAYAHKVALNHEPFNIERASDASEAFIRLDEPGFSRSLVLIVVGLRLPGLAGPAFVGELTARVPGVPILVIGRGGETASEYKGGNLRFLPSNTSADELLEGVKSFLSGARSGDGIKLVPSKF